MKTQSALLRASGLISTIFFCALPAWAQSPASYTEAAAEYGPEGDEPDTPPERGAVYARLRHFEGGISLKREDAAATEDLQLAVNTPLIPGDQIWTGEDGRLELQLADGTLLRLDNDSRLSLLNLSDQQTSFDDTTLLRLLDGSVYVRADGFDPRTRRFQIDTPAGSIFLLSSGVYRLDVGPGGVTTVASYRGVAEVLGEDVSVMAHSGERVTVEPGRRPTEARAFNTLRRDPFDVWAESRDDVYASGDSGRGARPDVPEPVEPYVSELSRYGVWRHDPSYGWIWIPDGTDDDWRPYYYGQWTYAPIGPTWVSYEPWGWAPYHYGRWHWAVGSGWFWIPGFVYSGAYVSWAVGPSYWGWCPIGYYNYPVYYQSYYPWSYVSFNFFFTPHVHRHVFSWADVARYRVDSTRVILNGRPVYRPGYRPEGFGTATYRRALANPRIAQARPAENGPKVPFHQDERREFRRAAARAASPERPSIPVRGGTPGLSRPRSIATGQPGARPVSPGVRPISSPGRGGSGARLISPATGRPVSPPVRIMPDPARVQPKTSPEPRDVTVRTVPRNDVAPKRTAGNAPAVPREAMERRRMTGQRGYITTPSVDSGPRPSTRPSETTARPRQAVPHPRVQPGRGNGNGRSPFVAPSRPSAPALKGVAPRPAAPPKGGGAAKPAAAGGGKGKSGKGGKR